MKSIQEKSGIHPSLLIQALGLTSVDCALRKAEGKQMVQISSVFLQVHFGEYRVCMAT